MKIKKLKNEKEREREGEKYVLPVVVKQSLLQTLEQIALNCWFMSTEDVIVGGIEFTMSVFMSVSVMSQEKSISIYKKEQH